MYQEILEMLRNWSKSHDRQAKLQHAYLVSAVVVLVAAGLIGLLNYGLGQSLLFISISLLIVFIANTVAWALLDSIVISRLASKRTSRK